MNRHARNNPMNHPLENLASLDLSSSLEENVALLNDIFDSCYDIVFHDVLMDGKPGYLIYLSEMVDDKKLAMLKQQLDTRNKSAASIQQLLSSREGDAVTNLKSVAKNILSGQSLLLIDQTEQAYLFPTAHQIDRHVSEAETERTVRGPKEGFIEDIQTNLRLIRRKLKTPSLKVEHMTIGSQTNTQVSIIYLKEIADDDVVKEVHNRLSRIEIDGVLDSSYLESMIKDAPKSPFPTMYSTERPDRICGGLLDGKVAILTDGSPFALTAPTTFVEFLHSSEDYYDSSIVATIIRWVRFLGLFVALILPAFYVAMASLHQDLLQIPFLLRIDANRETLPYPVLIEGIFMLLTYELLREAGLRMPKIFGGPIVSILGLVLIGQIGVQAGLLGPIMTIVVSVTALTSFILPNYEFHQIIRYCGIPLLLLSGAFGFMGILVGLMFGLTHLISLRSFGVPYFSPVSPARKEGWKDVFIRAPWWAMDTRPPGYDVHNVDRSGAANIARPPNNGKEGED